jgi:hypothetical protein
MNRKHLFAGLLAMFSFNSSSANMQRNSEPYPVVHSYAGSTSSQSIGLALIGSSRPKQCHLKRKTNKLRCKHNAKLKRRLHG